MAKLTPISAIGFGREAIMVLALGQRAQEYIALCGIFSHTNWKLFEARTCRKGLELVRQHGIRVVICETELPDGNWRTVLEELRTLSFHPQLIVSSQVADPQLWGEVLNLGAYDLLAAPIEPTEVRRLVTLAWHASKREVQPAAKVHMLAGETHAAAVHA